MMEMVSQMLPSWFDNRLCLGMGGPNDTAGGSHHGKAIDMLNGRARSTRMRRWG